MNSSPFMTAPGRTFSEATTASGKRDAHTLSMHLCSSLSIGPSFTQCRGLGHKQVVYEGVYCFQEESIIAHVLHLRLKVGGCTFGTVTCRILASKGSIGTAMDTWCSTPPLSMPDAPSTWYGYVSARALVHDRCWLPDGSH